MKSSEVRAVGSVLILDEAHHAAPSSGQRYAIESQITNWLYAVSGGAFAGAAVFAIGSAAKQSMGLSKYSRLVVLQVTLGPVLEEVVFRGYPFTLLMWSLDNLAAESRSRLAVIVSAGIRINVGSLRPSVEGITWACSETRAAS